MEENSGKEVRSAMLDAISTLIKSNEKTNPYDKTYIGRIDKSRGNDKYDVVINGKTYTNIPALSIFSFNKYDIVWCKAPQNNMNQLRITVGLSKNKFEEIIANNIVSNKITTDNIDSNSYILNGANISSKFYIDNDELLTEETKSTGDVSTYNLSNIYKNFIDMSATLLHSGNVSSGTISIPTLGQYKYINIIAVNENSEYASYIWQYDNREYTKMINSSTKDVNRYVGFRIYSDGIGIVFHENMSIAEIYGIGK